jgi:hypothetical protein
MTFPEQKASSISTHVQLIHHTLQVFTFTCRLFQNAWNRRLETGKQITIPLVRFCFFWKNIEHEEERKCIETGGDHVSRAVEASVW